jgi:hypothetical protein
MQCVTDEKETWQHCLLFNIVSVSTDYRVSVIHVAMLTAILANMERHMVLAYPVGETQIKGSSVR